jgi:hypothetical protein
MKMPGGAARAETRTCPHCKGTILKSAATCPACGHFLRFEAVRGAREPVAAFQPLRLEGVLRQSSLAEGYEYAIVVTVHNDRGEEITRQIVGVGVLKGKENRKVTVAVELYVPDGAKRPRTV